MKKQIVLFLAVVTAVSFLSSCATVFEGKFQNVVFESNVKGAIVKIDGQVVGRTPAVVSVRRQKAMRKVVVTKEGYGKKVVFMQTKINTAFWVGLLLGAGSSTDSSTGAMYSYAPGKYYIDLPKDGVGYQKKAKMRYFVLMNYDRINRDIARGEGDYLKSVAAFYGVKNAASLLPFLRKAQKDSKSIVEFGDALVAKI